MKKVDIKTIKVINMMNKEYWKEIYNLNLKRALTYGISCKFYVNNQKLSVIMEGSKRQFIKYLIVTILIDRKIVGNIKRLNSILFD